jgi:hypothetical protein
MAPVPIVVQPIWNSPCISDSIPDGYFGETLYAGPPQAQLPIAESLSSFAKSLSEISIASAFDQLALDHGRCLCLGYMAVFVGIETGVSIILGARLAKENP